MEHFHSHFKHCRSCSMLPRDADTQRWGAAGQSAKERGCPITPGYDIPEALAVVELALSQVALHQVDMLLAGCAGAAEHAALGPLPGLQRGIILGQNAQAAQDGDQELLPRPWILQNSCSLCKVHH